MEIVIEKGRRVLVAKEGCVIQSATDGSILKAEVSLITSYIKMKHVAVWLA